MRIYNIDDTNKLLKIFNEGGTLWFIERLDTNQFHYSPLEVLGTHERSNYPGGAWADKIDWHVVFGAYLTEEDALRASKSITEGGCDCCGHGAEIIPTRVTEHEFVNTKE